MRCLGVVLRKLLRQVWDLLQALPNAAPQVICDGLHVFRRICCAIHGVILVRPDSFKCLGSLIVPQTRRHIVLGSDCDRALSVASAAARADASDHEASDPQEEVRGLDRRRIGDLGPGLVDKGERAREDAGRRPLRKAQELVTRRPRGWSMDRDTVSWTGIAEAEAGAASEKITWRGWGSEPCLPSGFWPKSHRAKPVHFPSPPHRGPRRQHRLLAQDTRDDRAAHDRVVAATLDC